MKFIFGCVAALTLTVFIGITMNSAAQEDGTTGKPFPPLRDTASGDASDSSSVDSSRQTVGTDEVVSGELVAGEIASGEMKNEEKKLETVTLANGCFWCTEAVFQRLKGVESVRSGYIGGRGENPTYREVCSGITGHAEALEISYDPAEIRFEELLEVFWQTHDPTTLNRQGNDIGTQYRSGIFYHTEQQKELAETYKKKLDEAGVFNNPIVTEITPAPTFYAAEDYHQDYFNQNRQQGYCRMVIVPKIEKLKKVFADKLK